jgi:hypothetical protein
MRTKTKDFPLALSVRTADDEHVGYIPEDGYKFKGHQAMYEALVFGFEMYGVITEALYKTPAGKFSHLNIERKEAGKTARFAKGEFIDFEVELTLDMGDDSPSYQNEEGKEYLRLTHIISQYKWDPEDHGLEEWSINMFKSYQEYQTYLNGCAIDGQLLHHKAELASYKQGLPEGVSDLPAPVVNVIKHIKKVHNSEMKVYDDDIGVAGTNDLCADIEGLKAVSCTTGKVGTVNGKCIVDWKRSKQMQVKYLRQVAFYAKNHGCKHAIVVLSRQEGEQAIVHLGAREINMYYKQVAGLAKFIHSM